MRRFLKLFAAVLLLVAGFALYQLGNNNFHTVIPGELYRSGQFYAGDLAAYQQRYGIRSVINLRGENAGQGWYDTEVKEAKDAGIAHYDFRMSSKRLLAPAQVAELVKVMQGAEKPVLIHCSGGANRTSFAAATYLAAIKKADKDTAEGQLSAWFGNFPEWIGSRSVMTRNFRDISGEMFGYAPAPQR